MAAARSARVEIDDLTQLRFPSSASISPDGKRIVYVEKRSNLQRNRYDHDLMLIDIDSGDIHNLTPGEHSDTQPQWAADSRSLYFLSNRSGSTNIWCIAVDGGEAEALTHLSGQMGTPRVSPNGNYIAYTYAPKTDRQKMLEGGKEHPGPQYRHMTRLGYKLDGHGYFDDAWMHLYVLDVRTGKSRRLTSGKYHDGQHAWSPNGRQLAFVSNRIPRADYHINNTDVFVVSLQGGALKQLTRERGPKYSPSWSPDGKTIACIGHTNYPDWVENPHVMTVASRGGTLTDLTAQADLYCANEVISDTKDVPEGSAPTPLWSANGKKLRFLAAHEGCANLYEVNASGGAIQQLSHGKHEIAEFTQSAKGDRWALVRLDATSPGDVWVVESSGRKRAASNAKRSFVDGASTQQLTHIHRQTLRGKKVQRPQAIRVKSRDGHTVHGWVLYARGQKRKAPAVLMVHGGPYAAYGWSFFHEFQMLAAAGYHVVFTNIRGSATYGREYMRALIGKWGHVDFRDVTDVADWMEVQPWVDAKRMAIAGGSYGGYMTNWAVSHTRRFKCGITQRSVVNIPSFYGASDMGWDFEQEFGGHPWENHERFWRTSPLAFVERIRTPLLILHSDEDHRCPVSQAEELFVALKILNRDVEMVRFVGESHGLSRGGRPHNRLERLRRITDWFERKL